MYSNYSMLCGTTTAVLNAAAMQNDSKDVNLFINNLDNAVCYYDSIFQKIYINLNETGTSSRTNDWIKEFGKYFIFENSKKGIEDFHRIKIDPTFKLIYVNYILNDITKAKLTLKEFRKIDPKLFVSENYDSFISFDFNNNGEVVAGSVTNYEDNSYSYPLFKSILEIYKLEEDDTFYFFEFIDVDGNKSNAFMIEFNKTNSYELFDFSNRPPRGNGGPFFTFLLNLFGGFLNNIIKK